MLLSPLWIQGYYSYKYTPAGGHATLLRLTSAYFVSLWSAFPFHKDDIISADWFATTGKELPIPSELTLVYAPLLKSSFTHSPIACFLE